MKIRASYHGVNGEVELLELNLSFNGTYWTTDPTAAVETFEALSAGLGGDMDVWVENYEDSTHFGCNADRWEGPDGTVWSSEQVATEWGRMAQDEHGVRQARNTVVLPLDGVSDNVRGGLKAAFEDEMRHADRRLGFDYEGSDEDIDAYRDVMQALIDAL